METKKPRNRRAPVRKAKPTKFRNRWRIRWHDENGDRRTEVFVSYRAAALALKTRWAEVEMKVEAARAAAVKKMEAASAA